MPYGYSDIAEVIKAARAQRGLTQAALAEQLEMRQATVSRVESGADSRLGTVQQIARLLDLEIMLVPRSLVSTVRAVVAGRTDDRFADDDAESAG